MRQVIIDSGQNENILIFIMIYMLFSNWISQKITVLSFPRFVATLRFSQIWENEMGQALKVFNFDLSSISGGLFSLKYNMKFLHWLFKKILPSGDFGCTIIIFSKSGAGGSPCWLVMVVSWGPGVTPVFIHFF
jgi:hypothetical protein